MAKKAVIVISLIEESERIANENIEKEILNEFSEDPTQVPWMKGIEKVTVSKKMAKEQPKTRMKISILNGYVPVSLRAFFKTPMHPRRHMSRFHRYTKSYPCLLRVNKHGF